MPCQARIRKREQERKAICSHHVTRHSRLPEGPVAGDDIDSLHTPADLKAIAPKWKLITLGRRQVAAKIP